MPLLVHDVFVGINTLVRYQAATVQSIHVDAVKYPDKHVGAEHQVEHVHSTADGLYRTLRCGYHEVTTELGDVIQLGLEWTYFSDSIYKRNREDKMTVKLVLLNGGEQKYPPHEIYAMVSVEFKNQ
jgi:muramidase (phage lysozyme)